MKPRLPRNNKEYGTQEYWENRFVTETSCEWLLSFQQLAPQLDPLLSRYAVDDDKSKITILIIGCGNAPFSADLYDAGYSGIVNVDYSATVIAAMHERHAVRRPAMQWRVMDMTAMNVLDDASFDVVIDKAAMDALMTGEGDVWNPAAEVITASCAMCAHVARVMKDGGTFVQISLSQPHFRKKYLLGWHATTADAVLKTSDDTYSFKFAWTYRCEAAGRADDAGGFGHYLYIMTKQAKSEN